MPTYCCSCWENTSKQLPLQLPTNEPDRSTDLTPTFFNSNASPLNLTSFQASLFRNYQSYLAALSLTGNPNAARIGSSSPSTILWPLPTGVWEEKLGNVLNVTDAGFEIITDQESLYSHCDFFLNLQAAVTTAGGYVPPEGEVANNLGVVNQSPSATTLHRRE